MSEFQTKPGTSEVTAPPAPQFDVANQPSYAHTLFFGPDGLRPGWGFGFYALAFLMLQRIAVELAWMRDLGSSGLWSTMLEELSDFAAAVIPAIVLARVERRSWKAYGLPGTQAFRRFFWSGVLWGFLAISVLIYTLYGLRIFSFGHVVLHGTRIFRFAAFWAGWAVLVGLFEEFLLRGYSQFTLARGVGFWPAAVILSCTFGLMHLHNNGEQWRGLLAAACIGFFFCLTLRRTGSLWFAVGFHAAWDWGETFFYSVPDSGTRLPGHLLNSSLQGSSWLSGGTVGPEGSIVCFVVIAAAWFSFERIYRLGEKQKSISA